ncbi:hypothetical protein HPP92_019430 [Vanilla planifolia]|uniref:Uncharacterized protein n=1 Tax=Vanilla planifolia TaxID=51239 RepID=A0A835UMW6_VANPL|nr:hypothetical protein HPP92_019430 [Vanilla planifolia]
MGQDENVLHLHSAGLQDLSSMASQNDVLIRSFQLAFSLRNTSLDGRGLLPASRRRSLFAVATYMIVLSSKAFNIAPLIPIAKLSLNEKTDEQSSLRKQLLSEFMPVDVCPLGAQLIESPPQIAPFDSKHDYASQEQVMPPLFVIDDDANVEVCERPEDPLLQLNTNSTCLLSINELLETVPDTTIEA